MGCERMAWGGVGVLRVLRVLAVALGVAVTEGECYAITLVIGINGNVVPSGNG